MPRPISDAVHHSKQWLASTTGAPLRAAYDFLFPPLDELFLDDDLHTSAGSTASSSGLHADESLDRLQVWDTFSDSPWSFVTSRYAIALLVVAIVNNRVQHICRPRGGATARLSQLQRAALRLPSLVLLARSVLILLTVAADAFLAESNPLNLALRFCTTTKWRSAWLADVPMAGWASDWFGTSSRDALLRARDASALWAAFTSTCVAVISDAIVRNLDADREEPPAFNLVGFAFLLHFHSFSPEAPANEHVYLCILLQMLQIFTIAVSRCRRPVYARRLVISSVFGVSSLIHYGLAARSGRYPFLEALSRTPEIALVLVVLLTVTLHALTMILLEGRIQPNRLLFSRSNLPSLDEDWSLALFKLGTACMESTRLTGLEREMEPLVAWDAPYIELSSSGRIELVDPLASRTSAAQVSQPDSSAFSHGSNGAFGGGLSREVKQVRIEPTGQRGSSSTFGHAGLARIRALLQFVTVTLLVARNLAAMGLRKVLRAVGLPDPSVPAWVFRVLRLVRLAWHGSNGEARRSERQAAEQRRQHQEQQQRLRAQHQRQRHLQAWTASSSQESPRAEPSSMGSSLGISSRQFGREATDGPTERPSGKASSASIRRVETNEKWNGDSDAEDDDDYDNTIAETDAGSDSGADEAETDQEADESSLQPDEISGLLEELGSFSADDTTAPDPSTTSLQLTTLHSGTETFNQLLLAHLTRPRWQAPLTRSGYNALLVSSTATSSAMAQADLDLAQALVHRRNTSNAPTSKSATSSGGGDDARRLCVVCCTEERNVICWPCRCLCLCMDCREHLASRPPARRSSVANAADDAAAVGHGRRGRDDPTHLCPTCRTPVQAFSRLYIP